MLEVGHDVQGLFGFQLGTGQGAGEQRILAFVLEDAAIAGLASKVDAGAEGHVEAHGAHLVADLSADLIGERRIPCRGHGFTGGECGGVAAGASDAGDALVGVGHLQVGDAEARDAGNELKEHNGACQGTGLGLWPHEHLPSGAMQELDFSSRVICWMTMSARWSGERFLSDHG